MSLNTIIGGNIRRLRKAKGMLQEELCDKVSFTQGQLSRVENGRVAVSMDALEKFAKVLGVQPWELVRSPEPENYGLLEKLKSIERLPTKEKEALMLMMDSFLRDRERKKQ